MPQEKTALAVVRLKPRSKRYTVRVSRNLYVITQPSGSKSWAVRFGGQKLVLGPVDFEAPLGEPEIGQRLTLLMAKQLAAKVLQQRDSNIDPIAEHRAAKQRKRIESETAAGRTFGALARQFAEEHLRSLRSARKMARQLGLVIPKNGGEPTETKGGLAQRWRERDVTTIDASDIYSVINEARRRGTPGIKAHKRGLADGRARDLHTALSSMFGWLKKHGHATGVTVNPCTDVWRPLNASPRERWLTNEEIIRFWHACDKIHPTSAAVLRLLLLTGCRLREISEMRWVEIRENENELHLPGARTKNRRSHTVWLSAQAMEIIASVPRIEGCPFVFSTNGKTPISGWSNVKHDLDIAMGKPEPWIIHDLRRSAATGMSKLGIRPDVIELTINHISGFRRGVAGTYNRDAMLPQRTSAMRRWSQHISGLVSGDSRIVALARPRGRV
jgi:integrase